MEKLYEHIVNSLFVFAEGMGGIPSRFLFPAFGFLWMLPLSSPDFPFLDPERDPTRDDDLLSWDSLTDALTLKTYCLCLSCLDSAISG